MNENAIRVSDSTRKVHVDFNNIETSTGFRRLYTIHTAKTLDYSRQVGFHVGGFCDDRGQGGSSLAARTAGYEDLPSDLILCKMDDHYNFLPLNESELNCLYTYLTTGKVVPLESDDDTANAFFHKWNIQPILPHFDLPLSVEFFPRYPNVIALIYDETAAKTDKEIENYGKALFEFSDRCVNGLEDIGLCRVSLDHTYYMLNVRENGKWCCFIQALREKDESPFLLMARESLRGLDPGLAYPPLDDC